MWNTSSSIPFTSALHCVNLENLSRAQELHQNKYFHQKLSTTTNVFTPNHYHYHQVIFGSKFRRQVGLQIYVHSESKRPNLRQNDFPNHPPRNPHPRVIGPAHTRAERAGTLEGDFQKKLFFFQKIFSQKSGSTRPIGRTCLMILIFPGLRLTRRKRQSTSSKKDCALGICCRISTNPSVLSTKQKIFIAISGGKWVIWMRVTNSHPNDTELTITMT